MTTMLERAIACASEASGEALPYDTYRSIARAVLMAVREPDDKMLLYARHITDADAYEAFTAMIDAILSEPTE